MNEEKSTHRSPFDLLLLVELKMTEWQFCNELLIKPFNQKIKRLEDKSAILNLYSPESNVHST